MHRIISNLLCVQVLGEFYFARQRAITIYPKAASQYIFTLYNSKVVDVLRAQIKLHHVQGSNIKSYLQ